MQIPVEIRSSVNKAMYRLSIGDMTCEEMLLYLTDPRRKNTGFDREIGEKTVQFLRENGFLDDRRYLKEIVSKMDRSCYGPRKIREILIRHRFPPSYVEAALSRNVDYDKRARKRLDQIPRAKEISQTEPGRKKLVDALVRYGFDFSSARGAVEDLSGEEIISE